jgi:hypothetical protein
MRNKMWKLATLFGVTVLVMLVAVPIASAHHPVLIANLACDGTVTFTVTADIQNATRDNADVAIIDTSGGTQPIATGEFNTANNWTFSGSFAVPITVTSDTLTPQALGVWGDGYRPSNGPSTTITRPEGCSTTPVAQGRPAAPAATPAPQPTPAPPAAQPLPTPAATQPAVVAQLPPPAANGGSDYLTHAVVPLTPQAPLPPTTVRKSPKPVSGGTSLKTTHVAPFTPPTIGAVHPKLVSHAAPKTAG